MKELSDIYKEVGQQFIDDLFKDYLTVTEIEIFRKIIFCYISSTFSLSSTCSASSSSIKASDSV